MKKKVHSIVDVGLFCVVFYTEQTVSSTLAAAFTLLLFLALG